MGGNALHNCRQRRQNYGRRNCVVSGNKYHQKKYTQLLAKRQPLLREFVKNFYALAATANIPASTHFGRPLPEIPQVNALFPPQCPRRHSHQLEFPRFFGQ